MMENALVMKFSERATFRQVVAPREDDHPRDHFRAPRQTLPKAGLIDYMLAHAAFHAR
jgi:hypothetical protein